MSIVNYQLPKAPFIGKEKDNESYLGDFGFRKYDDGIGRFTSTEPLWEKYYGWTPYQYSANNPVMFLDVDGKDILVLQDKEGAMGFGHAAVLIGNDEDGWELFSKNGTALGIVGPSKDGQDGDNPNTKNEKENTYSSIEAFGKDKREAQTRYETGFLIKTDKEQDKKAKKSAKEAVNSWYFIVGASCIDVVSDALEAAGLDGGNKPPEKVAGRYGEYYTKPGGKDAQTNARIKHIERNNETEEIDLEQYR